MKQILIVEDHSFLNKMIDYTLTADGYGVTSALNARTAAEAIRQREFDLVLLDINLPDGNGFELCKLIKPQHPDTIVIFLTANDQESDQIRGYEVGAVDYITKPFGTPELLARIRAVLRRTGEKKGEIHEYGAIRIYPDSRRVTVNGSEISLTSKEFDLLDALISQPEKVCTRSQLLSTVWGYISDGESRTVDVHIKTLRQKLGEAGQLIETVRGMGYKIGGNEK